MTDFTTDMPAATYDIDEDSLDDEAPTAEDPSVSGDQADLDGGDDSEDDEVDGGAPGARPRNRKRSGEVPSRATITRIISIATATPAVTATLDAMFDCADLVGADRVHRILARSGEVSAALATINTIRELDPMEAAVMSTDLATDKAAFSRVAGILTRLGALTLPRQAAPGKAGLALARAIHALNDTDTRALEDAVEAAHL